MSGIQMVGESHATSPFEYWILILSGNQMVNVSGEAVCPSFFKFG